LTDPTTPVLQGFAFKVGVFAIDVVGDYAYTITSGLLQRIQAPESATYEHAVQQLPPDPEPYPMSDEQLAEAEEAPAGPAVHRTA
jgi:hypothetical protein